MERIVDVQTWEQALSKAKRLSAKGSGEGAVETLLPYIKELQEVPPSEQMISDLHKLSTCELGYALWKQAKGLEKAEYAFEYAKTLLTPEETLTQKMASLQQYFISRCFIHHNWLFYLPLPTKKVKARNAGLRLVAIPSFKRV